MPSYRCRRCTAVVEAPAKPTACPACGNAASSTRLPALRVSEATTDYHCRACDKAVALANWRDACPRCGVAEAGRADVIEEDPPPSSLTNTLAATGPSPELARFAAAPPAPFPLPEEIDCPRCAERIKAKAVMCRFCGLEGGGRSLEGIEPVHHRTRSSGRHRVEREVVREVRYVRDRSGPSPGVAAALSFVFVGFGHVYAGAILRGFAWLLWWPITIVLAVAIFRDPILAGLVGLGFWASNVVDAYICAHEQPAGAEDLTQRRRLRR